MKSNLKEVTPETVFGTVRIKVPDLIHYVEETFWWMVRKQLIESGQVQEAPGENANMTGLVVPCGWPWLDYRAVGIEEGNVVVFEIIPGPELLEPWEDSNE